MEMGEGAELSFEKMGGQGQVPKQNADIQDIEAYNVGKKRKGRGKI